MILVLHGRMELEIISFETNLYKYISCKEVTVTTQGFVKLGKVVSLTSKSRGRRILRHDWLYSASNIKIKQFLGVTLIMVLQRSASTNYIDELKLWHVAYC